MSNEHHFKIEPDEKRGIVFEVKGKNSDERKALIRETKDGSYRGKYIKQGIVHWCSGREEFIYQTIIKNNYQEISRLNKIVDDYCMIKELLK